FSAVPCVLILTQLSCWFSYRPLQVGEAAIVEVRLLPGISVADQAATVIAPAGAQAAFGVKPHALRIPALSEIDWRLRGERAGADSIEIQVAGKPPVRKQIVVGDSLQKVSRRRTAGNLWDQFLDPAEAPLDAASAI